MSVEDYRVVVLTKVVWFSIYISVEFIVLIDITVPFHRVMCDMIKYHKCKSFVSESSNSRHSMVMWLIETARLYVSAQTGFSTANAFAKFQRDIKTQNPFNHTWLGRLYKYNVISYVNIYTLIDCTLNSFTWMVFIPFKNRFPHDNITFNRGI